MNQKKETYCYEVVLHDIVKVVDWEEIPVRRVDRILRRFMNEDEAKRFSYEVSFETMRYDKFWRTQIHKRVFDAVDKVMSLSGSVDWECFVKPEVLDTMKIRNAYYNGKPYYLKSEKPTSEPLAIDNEIARLEKERDAKKRQKDNEQMTLGL